MTMLDSPSLHLPAVRFFACFPARFSSARFFST